MLLKLNTVWVLTKYELRSTIHGIGIYLTILTSLIVSSFILQNYLRSIGRDQILITTNPVAYPLFIAIAICTIYLALASVISVAREKDMQTLEVLFYGPVDHVSFILGKYLKGMLSYVFITLFLAAYFIIVSTTSNLGLSLRFFSLIALSLSFCSCIITFGILISTLTENIRASVLLFLGIVGGLLAIHITHGMLIKMGEENLNAPLLYLRNTITIVNVGVKWASPFYYMKEAIEAARIGSIEKYALSMVFSTIYSVFSLVISVLVLRKKGVRKTVGE